MCGLDFQAQRLQLSLNIRLDKFVDPMTIAYRNITMDRGKLYINKPHMNSKCDTNVWKYTRVHVYRGVIPCASHVQCTTWDQVELTWVHGNHKEG